MPAVRLVAIVVALLVGCAGGDEERQPARATTSNATLTKQIMEDVTTLPFTDRVGPRIRAACASARRLASVTVVCPTVIPSAPLEDPDAVAAMVSSPASYMVTVNAERNGRLLHWIVGGGTASDIRRSVLGDEFNEVKGLPKLVDARTVRGRSVELYRFPPFPAGGPNGGHIGAFVTVRRQVVFATVHGYRHADAAIAMAVTMASQLD